MSILAFGVPGGYELVIIGLVLLLLFGAGRIPDLARSLGSGVSEFKEGLRESREALAADEGSDPAALPDSTNETDGSNTK